MFISYLCRSSLWCKFTVSFCPPYYYDFVNEYRIDEFKRLVSSNEKDRYTLKALAGLCGFSSYTTFFRAFKETTGITPNEYMQQVESTGR